MSQLDTSALALPPHPQALAAAPEFGPLVRAQRIRAPLAVLSRSATPFWIMLGIAASKIARAIAGGPFVGEIALLASVFAAAAIIEFVPRLWRRWRFRRCPAWDGVGPPPAGAVRVIGRVRAVGEPFLLPGETRPVIYARTSFTEGKADGKPGKVDREDVRGVTLAIDLPAQISVRIAPEAVRLLDKESAVPEVGRWARSQLGAAWLGRSKGKLRRRSLREGDRVEAVGELVRDVSVDGAASPGRGVPMLHWLVPAWKGGVWIRQVGGA
jgi:hypothetical protein